MAQRSECVPIVRKSNVITPAAKAPVGGGVIARQLSRKTLLYRPILPQEGLDVAEEADNGI